MYLRLWCISALYYRRVLTKNIPKDKTKENVELDSNSLLPVADVY
jgi:hypothetical protein